MTYNDACTNLQAAIELASQGGLKHAIEEKAFVRTQKGWVIRPKCLAEGYSSGEAVICGILLCWFMELYGSASVMVPPHRRNKIVNTPADLVWPGAWYFCVAVNRLTEEKSLKAIKMLL